MYSRTRDGRNDSFLAAWDFEKDSENIYHVTYTEDDPCWQDNWGYCVGYDVIFDAAEDMVHERYEFEANNEEYALWMWKGNYANLGVGAELGIYRYKAAGVWSCDIAHAMPMTLILYDANGNTVFSYAPDELQWWITGFNPYVSRENAETLTAVATIDFSENIDLYKALYEMYRNNSALSFEDDYIVMVRW